MEQRQGIMFFRSYYEAILQIEPQDQHAALMAILAYAFDGEEKPLTGVPAAVFMLTKPNLNTSKKRSDSGKRGGQQKASAKQDESKDEAKAKQSGSKTEASDEQSPSQAQGIKDKGLRIKDKGQGIKENVEICADKPHSTRFVPPTLDEVTAYCAERGNLVNPQDFIDFYEAKGWMVGKTPMKDWKAACRRAEKWDNNTKPKAARNAMPSCTPDPDKARADMARLDRLLGELKDGG